jgi:hypothetical protein
MPRKIPVFIMEDVPVDIESLTMPQEHGGYDFDWHETVGTWVWRRETFDMYASLMSTLEGEALIFMNLGLDVNVSLTLEEVEELANWSPGVAILGGKCQGWILIKRALENTKWRGIIEIASNRSPDLEDLWDVIEPLATEPGRVQLKLARGPMSSDSLRQVRKVFDSGIKDYLEFVSPPPPPPLEKRL